MYIKHHIKYIYIEKPSLFQDVIFHDVSISFLWEGVHLPQNLTNSREFPAKLPDPMAAP